VATHKSAARRAHTVSSYTPSSTVALAFALPPLTHDFAVPHIFGLSLSQGGFNPEYDVGGIQDPYLQVKILQLLRVLGEWQARREGGGGVSQAAVGLRQQHLVPAALFGVVGQCQ
jgi:hypothetical protein